MEDASSMEALDSSSDVKDYLTRPFFALTERRLLMQISKQVKALVHIGDENVLFVVLIPVYQFKHIRAPGFGQFIK